MKNRLGFSKRRSSLRRRAARYTEEAVKRKGVTLGSARAVVGGKISCETGIEFKSPFFVPCASKYLESR